MPTATSEMPAVLLNGRIYVTGGFGGERTTQSYDPTTNSWAQHAEMPDTPATEQWLTLAPPQQPREHVAAVAVDGSLYLLAGRWQREGERRTVERYDPAADRWEEAPAVTIAGAGSIENQGRVLIWSPSVNQVK